MTREEIGRELFEIHNRIEELRLAAYADKEFYEFLDETEKEVYNNILFQAQSDIYFNFLTDLFTEEELADFHKKMLDNSRRKQYNRTIERRQRK